MDGFAESMIARGPTLTDDRERATGSLHVLGLPGIDAAREFVAAEPNNRAGLYAEHRIWRFVNLLGRTMWEFPAAALEPRFLAIARSDRDVGAVEPERLAPELRERLILYGALSTFDEGEPVGVALAVQAPDRDAVAALLDDGRTGRLEAVDIQHWEFGGRR
jgi:uncharacterized protein